jgi:deoxycytidylate deaminase
MACAAIPKESLKGATIWIAREFIYGGYALAMPCEQCRRLIEDMKFSRIVYTISEEPYFKVVKL